jgi:phenylpropionate dioxygenase-like ring-hydroxylating dioxygenase large terminal subunit
LRAVPYGDQGFPDLSKADHSLIALQVEEKHGLVFVLPDPQKTFDMDEFLGDVGAELDEWKFAERHYVETRNYPVNVNWKLNLDTFGESYHFTTVHPETFAKKTYENISTLKEFRYGHRACHPALVVDEMRHQPEEDWNLNFAMSIVYYIFPSTILFIVRGHMEAFTMFPGQRPHESITRHQMYLLDSAAPSSEPERRAIQELFDMVSHVLRNEDYPIVEQMQRNFLGCRNQKVTFGRNESGLHSMHTLLRREMIRQQNGGSGLRHPVA